MTVVADSSPLIILAKLNCFDFLRELYSQLCISTEVYEEVVITGAGLPGASQVAASGWIEVRSIHNPATLSAARKKLGLGVGELSTIILGQELGAQAVLLDDFKARELAKKEGLSVRGTVGILETLHRQGHVSDLRLKFQQLIMHNVYIDRRILDRRLRSLGIAPL
ncbi:MAG TPA: hypothetical protein VNV88_15045 [Candidatus Solibacter sp.]|nr:hypothetical protein [Candidatus Solibacter sp.]